jgi:hypothetical protein
MKSTAPEPSRSSLSVKSAQASSTPAFGGELKSELHLRNRPLRHLRKATTSTPKTGCEGIRAVPAAQWKPRR